jgi:hypothetical protein
MYCIKTAVANQHVTVKYTTFPYIHQDASQTPGRRNTTVSLRWGVTGSKSRAIRWVVHVAYMGDKLSSTI